MSRVSWCRRGDHLEITRPLPFVLVVVVAKGGGGGHMARGEASPPQGQQHERTAVQKLGGAKRQGCLGVSGHIGLPDGCPPGGVGEWGTSMTNGGALPWWCEPPISTAGEVLAGWTWAGVGVERAVPAWKALVKAARFALATTAATLA